MSGHDCGPVAGRCQDWQEHAREIEQGTRPGDGVFKIIGPGSATEPPRPTLSPRHQTEKAPWLCRLGLHRHWSPWAWTTPIEARCLRCGHSLLPPVSYEEGGSDRKPITNSLTPDQRGLPLHRTEAGFPRCSTCDGGGCPDCTDPA